MIIGLKCHGNDNTSGVIKKGGLKDVTFPGISGKVTKNQVRDAFVGKKVKGDGNIVKLGIVHLLCNFLFGSVNDTKVNNFFGLLLILRNLCLKTSHLGRCCGNYLVLQCGRPFLRKGKFMMIGLM